MSGIYGIYRYDGAPVDLVWLERMKAAMVYYGPHGHCSKIDGPVGMGHLLLKVNPEDTFESQPMRGERGLAVTDARLDNRAELIDVFHIPTAEAPQLSDGHLVSLAFDRWGEEVCSHLHGDWALAAWDKRARRLLLARGACSDYALYYYPGKGFIAFASSMKALLAIPGVVKEPNRLRLAQIVASTDYDAELTVYQGFRLLVAAQAMTVAHDGQSRAWRHWSPEGREPLRFRRDEDYVEGFLEHYTQALKSCLRSNKPVAAHLSGGRDSGSVVALAAPLLAAQRRELTAFTSVPFLPPDGAPPERSGNEWDLASASAAMAGPNVHHVPIDAADYGVIQGIEHSLDVYDYPSHTAMNHYWLQATWEAASRAGCGVLLVGQMGNASVSWSGNGSALLAVLRGDPATALQLLLHAETSPWLALKRQVLKPLWIPGLRMFRQFRTRFRRPWLDFSALTVQMAKDVDLDGWMQARGYDGTFTHSPLWDARSYLFNPDSGLLAGGSSEVGARYSFCMADPTVNLSLVEFLLRVPDNQFRRGDNGSWLFRRAFQKRLPDPVLNCRIKGLQAADAGHRIVRELPQFHERLDSIESCPEAREMLDIPRMRRCLDNLTRKVDPATTANANMLLVRGLTVGLFLRRLADSHC